MYLFNIYIMMTLLTGCIMDFLLHKYPFDDDEIMDVHRVQGHKIVHPKMYWIVMILLGSFWPIVLTLIVIGIITDQIKRKFQ